MRPSRGRPCLWPVVVFGFVLGATSGVEGGRLTPKTALLVGDLGASRPHNARIWTEEPGLDRRTGDIGTSLSM